MLTAYRHQQVVRHFHEVYFFVIQSSAMSHPYQGAVDKLRCYEYSHNDCFLFELHFDALVRA